MDSAKLNDWLQVIGLFSVVLSLLFVGMQMRQDLVIADATLYQMRADGSRELSMMMVDNKDVRGVFRKMYSGGVDALTVDEQQIFAFTFESVLNHYESSHYLYLKGLLSQEQWDSDIRQLRDLWRQSEVEKFWTDRRRASYRESFATEIDKVFD